MSTTPNQQEQGEVLVNWTTALEHTGDDKALLAELVVIFLGEAATLLSDMQRAIDAGDAKLLRLSGHTLKGLLRIFDSARAAEYATQMEQLGKDEQLDRAQDLLERLKPQMSLVIAEVGRYKPD